MAPRTVRIDEILCPWGTVPKAELDYRQEVIDWQKAGVMITESAKAIIESLKSTPAVLAILLFNVTFMALFAWSNVEERATWSRLIEATIQACTVRGQNP
jgi:hypothetical protein